MKKKDSFYFPHDYNARNDEKIKTLLAKYGYLGYGLYWALIEDLYQNENSMKLDYDVLSYDLRTSPDVLQTIIERFGLFNIDGGVFWSESVQRRLDFREAKSRKAKESVMNRWTKGVDEEDTNVIRSYNEKDTNVIRPEYDRYTRKEKKIKENKRKEKISKKINKKSFDFLENLIELGVDEKIANDWIEIRTNKNASNSEKSFTLIKNQIIKADLDGYSPTECITKAVERKWQGFKAEWMCEPDNKHLRLAESFSKKNTVSPTAKELNSWATALKKWIAANPNIDIKDVRQLILWYVENHNKQYVPTAYTMWQFIEKYDGIIRAKERLTQDAKPKVTLRNAYTGGDIHPKDEERDWVIVKHEKKMIEERRRRAEEANAIAEAFNEERRLEKEQELKDAEETKRKLEERKKRAAENPKPKKPRKDRGTFRVM